MNQQGWCTFKASQFEGEKRKEIIRKSLDVEMGAAFGWEQQMAEREGVIEAADPEGWVYFGSN